MKEYKVVKYWDDSLAEYYYRLEMTESGAVSFHTPTGDLSWAERQAKHYGVEITTEEEENDN